ncbi:MAG: ABC transporter permease [Bacteroidia bacterium]|nr:ABC transporter permease [Bacteroidia bacterium]
MSNGEQNINWDLSIRPKKNLLDINLKELWRYKDLIMLFVRRDFVSKYKQSILGPAWFIIQPLLTTLMFTLVFGKIAGIPTDGLPPMLFYMTGIVGWTYFSTCLTATSDTFISNAGIFGKVYFPRLVSPVSIVISNLIQFAIQFSFLIACMIFYWLSGAKFTPNIYVLLIPVLIVLLAGLSLGFGIIFSSLTTKYRDLRFLLVFGVQLWMYATPIIYPVSALPEKYKIFIIANPMSSIIEIFRYSLLGSGTINWFQLGYSAVFTLVILVIGVLVFNKVERTFMDTV